MSYVSKDSDPVFQRPFAGVPAKDVRFPDLYVPDIDRVRRGYLNPADGDACSEVYNKAYKAAWGNPEFSESADKEEYQNHMDKAGNRLYNYTTALIIGLGRGGKLQQQVSRGYTETKGHVESTYHPVYLPSDSIFKMGELDHFEEDSRKWVEDSAESHSMGFGAGLKPYEIKKAYDEFINDDPIYRPFKPLLQKKKDLSRNVEKLDRTRNCSDELKKKVSACRSKATAQGIFGILISPFLPGIPLYMMLSIVYVFIRKLINYRYAAEWFAEVKSQAFLGILELLIKLPGRLASYIANMICSPDNGARFVLVIIALLLIGVPFAIGIYLTAMPALIAFESRADNLEEEKRHRNELKVLEKEQKDLEDIYPEEKSRLDAFVNSEEYRQACETNKRLADAYLALFRDAYKQMSGK